MSEDSAGEELLTAETVPAFVTKKLETVKTLPLSAGSTLIADEIRGGNLNYAFVVKDAAGGSVFVKQAPDFIKVLGKDAKLSRNRMQLEVKFYSECRAVLGTLADRYLPQIYDFDEASMVFIMDFLGSYELLQKSLFMGVADSRAASGMGEFMGKLHAKTHSTKVATGEVARLSEVYQNATLRGIQLEYVFSKCFREDERAAHLREDAAFMAELEKLKVLYSGEDKSNLSLCHGDLHGGSVMADASVGSVKVIDPEFVIYGPPGLDVGSLLSTYALAYCYRSAIGNPCPELISAIEATWTSYTAAAKECGLGPDVLESIIQDAVGFAGCEVARTSLGMAYERSLKLEDPVLKDKAERKALAVGVACITDRKKGLAALIDALSSFKVE